MFLEEDAPPVIALERLAKKAGVSFSEEELQYLARSAPARLAKKAELTKAVAALNTDDVEPDLDESTPDKLSPTAPAAAATSQSDVDALYDNADEGEDTPVIDDAALRDDDTAVLPAVDTGSQNSDPNIPAAVEDKPAVTKKARKKAPKKKAPRRKKK